MGISALYCKKDRHIRVQPEFFRKADLHMNIRFYNAKILTMADGFEICEGELWVSGSEVVYVEMRECRNLFYGIERLMCREIC